MLKNIQSLKGARILKKSELQIIIGSGNNARTCQSRGGTCAAGLSCCYVAAENGFRCVESGTSSNCL